MTTELDSKTERAILKVIGKHLKDIGPEKQFWFGKETLATLSLCDVDITYAFMCKYRHLFEKRNHALYSSMIKEEYRAQIIADTEWTHVENGLPSDNKSCHVTIEWLYNGCMDTDRDWHVEGGEWFDVDRNRVSTATKPVAWKYAKPLEPYSGEYGKEKK